MHFTQGRPRFWVPGFDTAHLVLPALLGVAVLLIATRPSPPPPRPPTVQVPLPQRPTHATAILQPVSGAVLSSGQMKSIEGLAPPGAAVQLIWMDRPLGSPTRSGGDGRWAFSTAGFPSGRHAFRVVSHGPAGSVTSAPVVVAIQPRTPAPARTVRRP